ncbi:hypothetical protein JCM11641_004308 [Rhodosporidiobolus odoratus]
MSTWTEEPPRLIPTAMSGAAYVEMAGEFDWHICVGWLGQGKFLTASSDEKEIKYKEGCKIAFFIQATDDEDTALAVHVFTLGEYLEAGAIQRGTLKGGSERAKLLARSVEAAYEGRGAISKALQEAWAELKQEKAPEELTVGQKRNMALRGTQGTHRT